MKGKAKLLSPLLLVAMLFSLIGAAVTFSVVGNLPEPAYASPTHKSLYLIADHGAGEFDAWEILHDGTVAYQATYSLAVATDPSGIGIDEDTATLFVTSEFGDYIELVDAVTFTSLGSVVAPGATNLAGLAVDNMTNTVYTVDRATNHLYVYDWDPVNSTLVLQTEEDLVNCDGAWGLALDAVNGILYVADSLGGVVRGYDVTTWDEVWTFTPSQVPVGIAVDQERGLIYVSAPDGSCAPIGGTPHPGTNLLIKIDIATKTETSEDLVSGGGMGIAVDEETGYVYVTLGCSGDTLQVWDTSTTPWDLIQETDDIGNPAGICIPIAVVFNPLQLTKDDGVEECVPPGGSINYTICYNNTLNDFDVHDVVITDNLSANVTFDSATDGGVYDNVTHSVTWDIGTVLAGAATKCVHVEVTVKTTAPVNSTILNECTIEGLETGATTVYEETLVCEAIVPLGLEKDDGLPPGGCVDPGDDITYEICYWNPNTIDVHNVTLTDTLSSEVDFVSATGNYTIFGQIITWDIGTLLAGEEPPCIELVVNVHEDTTAFYITNICGIEGAEEGTSNQISVQTEVCSECPRGILQAEIIPPSPAAPVDVDGKIDGWYEETRFVGEFHGYSVGDWDCYIDGWFDGYVEGWFEGWFDDYWYDDWYSGNIYGDYVRGHFYGFHEGDFCGFVDGTFSGYKDGSFDGTIFEPVDDTVFWSDWYYNYGYIDDMFINTYFDGSFYGGKRIGYDYYTYYDGGYSVGDWSCYIDGWFEGDFDGYFRGWIYDYYRNAEWYEGWYDGWFDGLVEGHFEGWHDGYFDGYVEGVFSGYKGYWDGYYAYFYGDIAKAFEVTAKINNIGQVDVPSVYATLTIDGPAFVVCDDTQYVGTVTTDWPPPAEPYGYQEASWWVVCEYPGPVNLTVTPWAVPPEGVCAYSDTLTVCQADLVIEIIEYPLCSVNPCQTFSIKAEIYNPSCHATVEDVYAFIEISDPELASLIEGEPEGKFLGDIPPESWQEVSWTLHCDNPGDVIITVDAEGIAEVYSYETCQPCNITDYTAACVKSDSVYVRQNCPAELEVVVDAPDKVQECTEYEVSATITNTGDRDAHDVSATIELPDGVELVEPDFTIDIGTLPRGWSEEVSWIVHCNTTGTARITVVAEGKDNLTDEEISDTGSASVGQYDDFFVLIIEPEDGVTISSCQDFTVTAEVWNCNHTVYLEEVNVTISWPGGSPFELVEGAKTQTIEIDSDDHEDVTWVVHCTGAGTRTITVTATSDDPERWDDDDISVTQQNKAHLVAEIYFPDDGDSFATCQYFHVKGSVTNTGQATAEDVKVGIGIARDVVNETLGYGDNVTTEFDLDYGYGHFNMIIPGTLKVYVNDTLTTAYTIDYETNTINFTTAPEPDLRVSADYSWADTLESDGSFDVDKWVRCLGDIPGGVEVPVMWTLHCTDPGDVVITLVPAGKDANIEGRYSISKNNIEPADVAINQLGLDIDIWASDYDVNFCENFYVNAEVTNWGDETIEDVVATITINGHAELVGAQYVTKSLGDIRPGETHDVSWTLHCYGPDDAHIMVTASVTDTDAEISDYVCVAQYKDQDIKVIIESPQDYDDTYIATGQEFMVSAKIYNNGEATVTDIAATISVPWYDYYEYPGIPAPLEVVSPDATVEIGSLAPGEYKFVTWTLRGVWGVEEGYDVTEAEIEVCAVGYDIDTGEEIYDYDDVDVYVYPAAYLVVEITAPEDGSIYHTSSDFDVTATVTNIGFADAWDVSLTIGFEPEGSVVLTQGGYTVDVGNLAGHTQNGNATVTWHLHCKQVCSTTITVTAAGLDEFGWWYGLYLDMLDNPEGIGAAYAYYEIWDDYYSPGAPIADRFIESDSITVKQVDAFLVVDLSYPDEVYAGRTFAVTATITNTGNTDALGVTATITVAGPASVDGSATKTVGTIGARDSATVSWELECEDEGGISVAVSASGTNTNIASDSGAVQQSAAPAGWGGLIWGLIGAALIVGICILVCCWLRYRRE